MGRRTLRILNVIAGLVFWGFAARLLVRLFSHLN
jgi:hypothetical protein